MPRAKRIKVRITKRGRERLKKLGEFLKTVPDERFDMGFWARIEGDDAQGEVGDTADCATAACALGWATVVFPRSLKLGWCHFAPYLNRMSAEVVRVGAGTKETCSGEDAAQDFFQMEEGLANYLFTPEADSMFPSHDQTAPSLFGIPLHPLLELSQRVPSASHFRDRSIPGNAD